MNTERSSQSTLQRPLRLWPGVVAVVLQWLAWFVVPIFLQGMTVMYTWVFGGLLGGLAIVLWWVFFSRAPWVDRLAAVVLAVVALAATMHFLHESVAMLGMGMLFSFYAIPVLSLAFVASAVAGRRLADGPRRLVMAGGILLACGGWLLVRTDGLTGDSVAQFSWRWSETPEQQLLAQGADEPVGLARALAATGTRADWPGFRGPHRDGTIRGVGIETDWSVSPPVELWRRPIGPAWSSLAVRGELFYTQEQRGEEEVVACYWTKTGEPVWRHHDAVRFWESNSGPGPRATPTIHGGRVYTFGATGILNALNAADGAVMWSRNVASDCDRGVPYWGFASSPLVVDDLVIVAASGRLVAYGLADGDPRWFAEPAGGSFSSPHLLALGGVPQILLLSGSGLTSVAPSDGTLLWEHAWPADSRVLQPALTADGDILLGSGYQTGIGMRRIAVTKGTGGWTSEERWTSNGLKSYFNDFVVHKGHAFGFDGRILSSIDLEDGERKWKGGRYGHGQLVLLPEQDLLLVLTEEGELALVSAAPDGFNELARFPAIEGKTWNHPVLVGDLLLVRNSEEMAAFRLSQAGG